MTDLLKDKVALITGASRARGIGKATAKLFAQHGARVAILDLDEGEAHQAARDLGPRHFGIGCDVTDPAQCVAAVERVLAETGRIDVLVNNAGLSQRKRITDISVDDYDRIMNVVLRGTLLMSQAVIPHMRQQGQGSIVCVSSTSAQQGGGIFGGPHYCAAKAGVLGLVRAMAKELGPENIRVNAIAPGLTLTDFSNGRNPDDNKLEMAKAYPLGRVGYPEEIGGACLFLASDLASYVTGTTLDVNGGAYLR